MICHYAEWNYVECRNFFSFLLSVIVLSVVMLNVIMLSVIVQSVVMLNVIMLSVIVLSVVMRNVITLNVVAPSLWSYFTNIRLGWKWLLVSVTDAGQVPIGKLALAVVNSITVNFVPLG